ncbi:MAG: carbon storage regulator CsrA [Deltaproteobacteria bacterium]|nr:carbon storage regulator CsrA [Deltaproteobacteria bacterium]
MLVLTRKIGETIRIGDEVRVQVLAIRGGQVRLGLTAPPQVRIFREEIFRTIEDQNQRARLVGEDRLAGAAELWEEVGHGKHG